MGQRTGILRELPRAQPAHVIDAFDRPRAQVPGEFLVAENREPFLEGKLEPVAAGDAVAGPVVEIFVRDDGFDAGDSRRRLRFPGDASTYLSLKMLRPLFSIAPMLKSETATIMKMSRSYSRPKPSHPNAWRV